jgi:hypothetical protein
MKDAKAGITSSNYGQLITEIRRKSWEFTEMERLFLRQAIW